MSRHLNFIDSLLKIAVPNLPIKEELGGMETGSIHRAAGAALQARLYFNAKSYIGKEMFTEEEIAESDLRVALIGELIKARRERGISQREPGKMSGVK